MEIDLTKPPLAVFRPLPPGSRIEDSVHCLVVASLQDGDPCDCNKAAEELVDSLRTMFDAVVTYTGIRPECYDMAYDERDRFVYYAVMERMGHGVGLTDDRDRFPEAAVNLARDRESVLYGKIGEVVDWLEANMAGGVEPWYEIQGNLCIHIAVYTAASVEDGEAAASMFLPGVGVDDVLSDVVGFAEDCETTDEEVDVETSDISLGLFLYTLETALEEYAVERSGTCWRVCIQQDELLSRNSYRSLPYLKGVEQGDDESDEDYDLRAEVVGVDVSWRFDSVDTYDGNGPDTSVKWYNENLEDLVEDLVRATDWYFDQYQSAKEKDAEAAAAAAAKEEPDADSSEAAEE